MLSDETISLDAQQIMKNENQRINLFVHVI